MNMNDVVSVIIAVYNIEDYLEYCLESVINQTYSALDIIVVNDGSTDNSGRICEKYSKRDTRIRVFNKDNGGLVSARKYGLERAQGTYISFIDGDDVLQNKMYEILMNIVQDSELDMVHMGYVEGVGELDIKKLVCKYDEGLINLNTSGEKKRFIEQYVIGTEHRHVKSSIWSKIVTKEIAISCYNLIPDESQYGEDFLFLLLVILKSKKIYLTKECLYYYRIREDSMSHCEGQSIVFKEICLMSDVYRILTKVNQSEWLQESISYIVKKRVSNIIELMFDRSIIAKYFYTREDVELFYDKRVVIYGAGSVGKDIYSQLSKYERISIVNWVDKNYRNINMNYHDIISPETVKAMQFDYLIIAIKNEKVAKMVTKELVDCGVNSSKIIWIKAREYA